jgi:hypothetical protein
MAAASFMADLLAARATLLLADLPLARDARLAGRLDLVDPFSGKSQAELVGRAGAGLVGLVVMDLHARDRRSENAASVSRPAAVVAIRWRRNRRAVQ